ncbi:MAG TPA: hypothetical protein VG944_19465 [Fimbriimonas sp.]|nr:hypothetical protein [Fimbriimonas sp.]
MLRFEVSHGCLAQTRWAHPEFESFKYRASDGKLYTIQQLANGKPIFFVFFFGEKEPFSIVRMNMLNRWFGGKVRLVGLVNDLRKGYITSFARQHKAEFLILSNPQNDLLFQDRNASIAGLDNWLITPEGGFVRRWHGYDRHTLREMTATLRERLDIIIRLDASVFPSKLQVGKAMMIGMGRL